MSKWSIKRLCSYIKESNLNEPIPTFLCSDISCYNCPLENIPCHKVCTLTKEAANKWVKDNK